MALVQLLHSNVVEIVGKKCSCKKNSKFHERTEQAIVQNRCVPFDKDEEFVLTEVNPVETESCQIQ